MYLAGSAKTSRRDRIIDHPGRRFGLKATMNAVRGILKLEPDVLVCSLWRSVIVGILVKLLRPRTRFVCFLHNIIPVHAIDGAVHKFGCAASDEIWADSEATLAARAGGADRARVISFVTQQRDRVAPPVPSASFASWCRLNHQKGIDRAIHLIGLLIARGVDARLSVWGADDGQRAELIRLAGKLQIEDRVRFPGALDPSNLPQVAAENCFYLQLSRHEGMAMSVVEAMQMGLVPVATAVGQIPHYVAHGENGLIVDPNRLAAAAAELAEIIDQPQTYARMSAAAAETWHDAPLFAQDLCNAAVELIASTRAGTGTD